MSLELTLNRARISAGELAYVDMGEGPSVLLLHGFPTSSYLWRREVWLLAQRMRVIAPDLLGYGDSDKPEDADLSELAQASYVLELLAQLGVDELAIVGHDIGGAMAQLLALGGELKVRTSVLLDSACFDAWPIEGVKMLQATTPEQETPEFVDEILRLTFDLGISHRSRVDESTIEAYLRPWRADPRAFFRATRGISGRGLSGRDGELAALDQRVLIIWGEDDPFLDSGLGERLGDAIPGSTVALLPGCSHFVTEDAPQTVGPLIYEFLRSQYLRDRHSHVHEPGPVPVFRERPQDGFVDADILGEEG